SVVHTIQYDSGRRVTCLAQGTCGEIRDMQTPVKDSNIRGAARPRPESLVAAAMILLSALLAPALGVAGTGWWNPDWQFRKALTIRLPAAEAGAPSTIVLPIRLHPGNFEYFPDMQANGADLRFVAGDGT